MFDINKSAKSNFSHHWDFTSLGIGMIKLFKNQDLTVFNPSNRLSEAGHQIKCCFL